MGLFSTSKTTAFPEFWNNYLNAFTEQKRKAGLWGSTVEDKDFDSCRFVVFDTETTGLDYKKDRILSIGGVAVVGNQVSVSDSLELYVLQDIYNPESAPIHGILKGGYYQKVNEQEAIKGCLEFIGTAILVGHHIGFDIAVINQSLKRYGLGKIKNKILDTEVLYKRLVHPVNRALQDKHYSLDQLAEALKIPVHDRHTAAGDSLITALAFIKIVHKLDSDGQLKVKQLFRR